MEENTVKLIKGRISVLPKQLQEILLGDSWRSMVKNIGDRYQFNDEEKESLKTEIFLVLAGLEPISNFRTNLVEELETSYDKAIKISYDANLHIFGPVIEILKNLEQEIKKVDEESSIEEPLAVSALENELSGQQKTVGNEKVTGNTPTPEFTKDGQRNGPEAHPEHILMDHEQMEKMDGMHLHSQSVMPTKTSASMSPPQRTHRIFSHTPKPTPPPAPAPFNPTHSVSPSNLPTASTPTPAPSQPQTPPKPSFRSIVDEKLSSLVRTTNETKGYKGNDPYREPIE